MVLFLISKCSCVLNNFRHCFHAKTFKILLTILFNKCWLCLSNLLVKVTAIYVKYLLRFLPYFFIISLFLIDAYYYVSSMLQSSYLYVGFVNACVYILTEIPIRLSNFFYTNSFIFGEVNVDVEKTMQSNLVICNNLINRLKCYLLSILNLKVSFQLLQTDITPEKECSNNSCFSLALFIFSIMFVRVLLKNKHERVKAFFGYIIF